MKGSKLRKICVLGWHTEYSGKYKFDRYVPSNIERNEIKQKSLIEWKLDQVKILEIDFLLSLLLFKRASIEVKWSRVHDILDLEYDKMKVYNNVFAINLIFILYNFSNISHKNNDYNKYTYRNVYKGFGKLTLLAEDFECKGGEFVVISYRVYIDYSI